MINATMRSYTYSTLGPVDEYGIPTLIPASGTIKLSINISSQSVQDNINYQNCNYVGLTMDKSINDNMVINFGTEKLKVQYVNPMGRYTQVFLKTYEY